MTVRYEQSGGVVTVTLDRPEVLNALRSQEFDLLRDHLDRAAADPLARVMVLTGSGGAFCAGEDLRHLSGQLDLLEPATARAHLDRLQDLTRRLRTMPVPVLAAVNGVAVGVGAELAIAADLRIAARSARIGFPEVRRGLYETNGVTWLLPRMLGSGRALRMMLDGGLRDADTCAAWGLVDEVVDDASLADHVRLVAHTIVSNAPLPVRLLTAAVRRSAEQSLEQALAAEVDATLACLATQDVREGTAAFLAGRDPVFEDR